MEIWSLNGKNVVRSLVWTPFSDDPGWGHDVNWAAFIDAKRLALCSGSGKLAIWNLATCQPICHTHVTNGGHPALSPDRKWLAYVGDDTLGLIDIEKQEVIAATPIARKLQAPALAFSPSGKRIGCVANDRILVWDTATGKLEKDFAITGINMGGEIAYPDEDFILAGNQFLIELKDQLKLWQYQGADRVRTVGGTTLIAATGDARSGVLFAAKLPHPQALAMLKKALGPIRPVCLPQGDARQARRLGHSRCRRAEQGERGVDQEARRHEVPGGRRRKGRCRGATSKGRNRGKSPTSIPALTRCKSISRS